MPYNEIWQENLPNMLEVSREVTEMTKIKRKKENWVVSCVQGNQNSLVYKLKYTLTTALINSSKTLLQS